MIKVDMLFQVGGESMDQCATCRFYQPDGSGKGYCSYWEKTVKHGGKCSEYQEQ